jgi:hypothetical protein
LDSLKAQLRLNRLLNPDYKGDDDETIYTDNERRDLPFKNDRISCHKALRINYTTYDMRREQDSVNPRTHANVMLLSHSDDESAHPSILIMPLTL